ncbi:hypothetical protein AAC387_Pa12g0950 [Persea americana]
MGRVRKIVKLDKEINRVNSEASSSSPTPSISSSISSLKNLCKSPSTRSAILSRATTFGSLLRDTHPPPTFSSIPSQCPLSHVFTLRRTRRSPHPRMVRRSCSRQVFDELTISSTMLQVKPNDHFPFLFFSL